METPTRLPTEKQLLAMSTKRYMCDEQLAFFRRRLEQQQDALLANARETIHHITDDSEPLADPSDRASSEESHRLELRIRDRERKMLQVIDSALRRISSGEYGYCKDDGSEIGLRRLLARPTASLSLAAQERREMRDKVYQD